MKELVFLQWMFWHHDVGLSFPKSVGALIGGSADLFVGVLFGQEVFLQREIIADEKPIYIKWKTDILFSIVWL